LSFMTQLNSSHFSIFSVWLSATRLRLFLPACYPKNGSFPAL
jgi:hypothetical protein